METLTPNNPSKWFYWFLLGIACAMLIILSGCSCNSLMSRIQKKNCATFRNDTLLVHDTIRINEIRRDTTFRFTHTSDTIRLNNDRLHIKYFFNTHDSTIYLAGKCDSIIVYREIKVPYTQNVFNFDYIKHYRWYIIIGLLIICTIFVLRKFLV